MTLEEKIDWIHNATNEELLDQFATNNRYNIWEASERFNVSITEITRLNNETKAEILRRMSK